MTAPTYQYVDLPGASVVVPRALLAARENLGDTVAARAMMCLHGGAGFGKTLAVNTCLHEFEPGEDVRRITFHARPTTRAVGHELFTALELPGCPPRYAGEFDHLLKNSLSTRPRTLVLHEAQWLSSGLLEYVRYLCDDPHAQLAVLGEARAIDRFRSGSGGLRLTLAWRAGLRGTAATGRGMGWSATASPVSGRARSACAGAMTAAAWSPSPGATNTALPRGR
ncbi:ATP-binding protein [Streptomyces nojiriensis]|uniref:ATP-binding protein n=1 Tax=Streptomyces nojiriensis TaxID=66374 RepID=UPI002E19F36E